MTHCKKISKDKTDSKNVLKEKIANHNNLVAEEYYFFLGELDEPSANDSKFFKKYTIEIYPLKTYHCAYKGKTFKVSLVPGK